MKKHYNITKFLFAAFILLIGCKSNDKKLSIAFGDAIIDRYANINDLTDKGWEYSNSIVLISFEKLYKETNDVKYLNYIKTYADNYIEEDGSIDYNRSAHNLDHIQPGLLALGLYEMTGEEKYALAAKSIRKDVDELPVNSVGGFWHKGDYPNQMWGDGIYMAEPFVMRYGAMFNDIEKSAEIATYQITLFAEHAYDSTRNLTVHAWDITKEASWADPATGLSPEVWSRGMGWYCMALVDVLEYLPKDHKNYNRLIEITRGLAKGLKTYQDEKSGLWFQVVDKGREKGNWIETSGSSMFVYFLKTAIDKGYINSDVYLPIVNKAWIGLKQNVSYDNKGPIINNFVRSMGVQNNYDEYIAVEKVSVPGSRHPHGYCGILLASIVMEL